MGGTGYQHGCGSGREAWGLSKGTTLRQQVDAALVHVPVTLDTLVTLVEQSLQPPVNIFPGFSIPAQI